MQEIKKKPDLRFHNLNNTDAAKKSPGFQVLAGSGLLLRLGKRYTIIVSIQVLFNW